MARRIRLTASVQRRYSFRQSQSGTAVSVSETTGRRSSAAGPTGGNMDDGIDRRALMLGFVAAAFGTLAARGANAAGSFGNQPWAVWEYKEKPVRGGIYRVAAEQYIGKM